MIFYKINKIKGVHIQTFCRFERLPLVPAVFRVLAATGRSSSVTLAEDFREAARGAGRVEAVERPFFAAGGSEPTVWRFLRAAVAAVTIGLSAGEALLSSGSAEQSGTKLDRFRKDGGSGDCRAARFTLKVRRSALTTGVIRCDRPDDTGACAIWLQAAV